MLLSDVSKRVITVKGIEEVRRIESINNGIDILKVKNLNGDIWQIELIKRVGDYYKSKKRRIWT